MSYNKSEETRESFASFKELYFQLKNEMESVQFPSKSKLKKLLTRMRLTLDEA